MTKKKKNKESTVLLESYFYSHVIAIMNLSDQEFIEWISHRHISSLSVLDLGLLC